MLNGSLSERLPGTLKRLLHGRPLLQRLLGNSAWQIGDKVVRLGAGVLVNVYIARYLGPGDFGLLNFAVALTALFSAVAAFGLPSVVVRDLVTRPQDRRTIVATAWLLRLAGGVAAIALSALGSHALRAGELRSQLIVTVVALCNLPLAWDVIDYAYQSQIDARPVVIARNIGFVLAALLRVALVLAGSSLTGFAWAIVAEGLFSAALLARQSRIDRVAIVPSAATWQEARRLVMTSWPLVIAGMSVSIYMRVDQVMLGNLIGNAGVGLFAAAVRVSEALYFLPVAVAASVAPALTALHGKSREQYQQRFLQLTRLLVWLAFAVALLFSVFSKPLILALYGRQYLASAGVLAIHAWAGVLVSLGVCGTLWLTNAGFFKCSMYQTLVGAFVNVVLNLLLIPSHGIIGAAIATCAGQFAAVILAMAVIPSTRPLFRLQLAALVPRFSAAPG